MTSANNNDMAMAHHAGRVVDEMKVKTKRRTSLSKIVQEPKANLGRAELGASGRVQFRFQKQSSVSALAGSAFFLKESLEDAMLSSSEQADPEASMLWLWGNGKYGRLGTVVENDVYVPTTLSAVAGHVVEWVSCGAFGTAIVCDKGKLLMCGKDINDLFARPSEPNTPDVCCPIPVPFFESISLKCVEVGETMAVALNEFGTLYWWGRGHTPAPARKELKMQSISCGGSHAVAVSEEGVAYSWGSNDCRQLGHGSVGEFVDNPTVIPLPTSSGSIKDIVCSYSSTAAVTELGRVFAWGTVVGQQDRQELRELSNLRVSKVSCCDTYIGAVTCTGSAFLWHSSKLSFLGPFGNENPTQVFPSVSVRSLVCGGQFVLAISDSGVVFGWGKSCPMLGLGEVRAKKTVIGPKMMNSVASKFVRSISIGTRHLACVVSQSNLLTSQRETIGWELLASERVHVRSLVILLDVMKPVVKKEKKLNKLFEELGTMLSVHRGLLRQIETKVIAGVGDDMRLGQIFLTLSSKRFLDRIIKFEKMHREWARKAVAYQPGGKYYTLPEDSMKELEEVRKSETAYEVGKPTHVAGLMKEPFERCRQYFWYACRLRQVTETWHPDSKDLTAASERFEKDLAGYYNEQEMLQMTITRLESDKEQLLLKLQVLSNTNDQLFLSRNNHEMQKRDLNETLERNDHILSNLRNENNRLKEKILSLYLEKRLESISARKAGTLLQICADERDAIKAENKRLRAELRETRASVVFKELKQLNQKLLQRESEIQELRETQFKQSHLDNVERENARLRSQLKKTNKRLNEAIRTRYDPLCPVDDLDTSAKLLFTEEGEIRGGTRQALLELVVDARTDMHFDSEEQRHNYQHTFLMTFRRFFTPIELLYGLSEQYCQVPAKTDPNLRWSRVLSVIQMWMSEHTADFVESEELRVVLKQFLDETVTVTLSPSAANAIKRDYEKLTDFLHPSPSLRKSQALVMELMKRSQNLGASIITPNVKVLRTHSSLMLATELALVEHEVFSRLQPKELLNSAWTKSTKEVISPHVVTLITHFNRVSSWVVTEVLQQKSTKRRVEAMIKLIHVGVEARKIGSLNTVMEICAGLNNGAVQRLKACWAAIPKRDQNHFTELEELVSQSSSYKAMRAEMRSHDQDNTYCLPYLGVYLTDLTMADEGTMALIEPGVINWGKLDTLGTIISELLSYRDKKQWQPESDPRLREYLISSQVLTEDEAWNLSEEILPRKQAVQ